MKNRAIKLIICICVISCLMVGFCTAFASAEPAWLIRAKAGVAAAMLASQLVINPIDVVLSEPIASGIDPLGQLEWVESLPEYFERSTIKVVADHAFIDGQYYSQLWLGPEAADKLRLQGLDFATAYDILNNQSEAISYATGAGYIDDVPFYNVNGNIVTPSYIGSETTSSSSGLFGYEVIHPIPQITGYNWFWADGIGSPGLYTEYKPPTGRAIHVIGNNFAIESWNGSMWQRSNERTFQNYDNTPFSFDYTSGVIDAPIDPEDGLLLTIPSSYTDPQNPQYNYDIHDLINIYPQVSQDHGATIEIDPNLNPEFQTDIDLGNGVGDLIRTILTLLDVLDNIDIEFAPEPEEPGPGPEPEPGTIDPLPDPDPEPDVPVSGTTIADTDWTKLDEILRWIQSTIDSIRHITESLQTMLDSLFDQLQDIIQALQELPEQLLEDIETGPSKVFRKALDVLKSLFMPLLLPIKALMNLWHYVVEWIQSISSPFAWIFGVMSGTSYNMVLPIYAVLAGSICIAIYKALGR